MHHRPHDPESVFTYGAPALKFGPGAADEIGHDLQQYGARRVLVVTDARIAATMPSIMPLGATISAPACAWLMLTRPRTSRVASFAPKEKTTRPSRAGPRRGATSARQRALMSAVVSRRMPRL